MPEIPKLQECTIVTVCGPVSSGKTWLLEEWFRTLERVLFIDSTVSLFDDDYEHIFNNPEQLCWRLEKNPHYYRIAYHPKSMEGAFQWCSTAMWTLPHPRWLIIDEVHRVCGVQSMEPMMEELLRYCRHLYLGVIGASQRIADVSRLMTSGSRMVVLFYTEEARDLDAVDDRYGRQVTNAVTKLRPCIFDDVTKICHQHPECLVIMRGQGYRVFSLGDKVDTRTTGENEQWEPIGQATPTKPDVPSLEVDSGNEEVNSTDVSLNNDRQKTE